MNKEEELNTPSDLLMTDGAAVAFRVKCEITHSLLPLIAIKMKIKRMNY